jgi:flagellar biosynthetic protein FliR
MLMQHDKPHRCPAQCLADQFHLAAHPHSRADHGGTGIRAPCRARARQNRAWHFHRPDHRPHPAADADVGLGSWHGLFILVQQLLIGVSIGFIMRIVFAAVEAAGEIVGLQMGLGFASFFDPQSAGQTLVLARFFNMLALLVFLAVNAHLLLIGVLVDSFQTLPISPQPLSAAGFYNVAAFGSTVFAVGLQLALPLIAILLMTNLSLGILTRSAPQLNIFAIGFPITLGVGLIVLDLTLPYFVPQLEQMLQNGFQATTMLIQTLRPGGV